MSLISMCEASVIIYVSSLPVGKQRNFVYPTPGPSTAAKGKN